MQRSHWLLFFSLSAPVLAVGLLLTGCKDIGTGPAGPDENVHLSVQAAGSVTQHKPSHEVLHITSVKVLIKRIAFGQATSDDSSDVHSGPLVVDLNLEAKMTILTAARIRPGTYDRIRFDLHKPEDDEIPSDPVFRVGSSGDQRFSVVITGVYHDAPFTFTSRESARQQLLLDAPAVIPESGTVNVTIKVDPYAWFSSGELVYDPVLQTREIDDRIKASFALAFRDNDRNGNPD